MRKLENMCSVLPLSDRKRKLPSSKKDEKCAIKVESSALMEGSCSLSCNDENAYSKHSNNKNSLEEFKMDVKNEFIKPECQQTPKKLKQKKQFPCPIDGCGKSFPQKFNLERHYKSFHEVEEGKCHLCELCLMELPTKHDLILHQDTKHPVATTKLSSSHVCQEPGCEKKYTRRDHLLRHMRTCHPSTMVKLEGQVDDDGDTKKMSSQQFECTLCGATFNYKHGLVRHHTRTHTNMNRPYECTTCLQRFKKKSELQAHSYVHTGILPFACDFCQDNNKNDVRFMKKFQLTRHLRKHNRTSDTSKVDSLVFVCDQENCQEFFFSQKELTEHQTQANHKSSSKDVNSKSKTQQQQTFILQMACSVCHQVFTRRRALRLHLKTHEEALEARKIFMCLQCDKSYTSKSNLKTHLKTVHELVETNVLVLPFQCPDPNCTGTFAYKHVLERHIEKIHQQSKEEHKSKKRKSKWYEEETDESFQNLKKRLFGSI